MLDSTRPQSPSLPPLSESALTLPLDSTKGRAAKPHWELSFSGTASLPDSNHQTGKVIYFSNGSHSNGRYSLEGFSLAELQAQADCNHLLPVAH